MTIAYTDLCKQPRVDLNTSPLAAPLNVYVEPTNLCNFTCRCCPESLPNFHRIQGGKHMLSWADWESVADKIAAVGKLGSLHFYMLGEPLLNKHTCDMIADATERRLAEKTILTTNGTHVGRYATALAASGLSYLRVSLYDEYVHTWAAIASGLQSLRACRIDKPFVYVKAFKDELAVKALFESVADEIEIVPTMNWNGTAGERGDNWSGPPKACPMPFYTLVVHSDLRVSVCCVDWDKKLVVGDLKKQSIAEVWNSDEMHRIRLKHLSGKAGDLAGCKNCTIPHMLQDVVDISPMEYTRRVYGTALREAQ